MIPSTSLFKEDKQKRDGFSVGKAAVDYLDAALLAQQYMVDARQCSSVKISELISFVNSKTYCLAQNEKRVQRQSYDFESRWIKCSA